MLGPLQPSVQNIINSLMLTQENKMKLKLLKLQNFFSHEASSINFDKIEPVTMVLGSVEGDLRNSNGSGKTTIIEAILFALFEKSRLLESKNGTLDDMVRWNSNGKMLVELQFELNNEIYKITRARDKNKQKTQTSLEVLVNDNWKSLSEAKKNDTNKQILKLIGVDYETFSASVCFQQKEVDKFISASETERKNIIKSILQLDKYDEYKNLAKAKLQNIEGELNQTKFILETQSVNSLDLEIKAKIIDEIEQKIKAVVIEKASVESQLEKLRYKQISFNDKLQSISQIENEITDKQNQVKRLDQQKQASSKKLNDYSIIVSTKQQEINKLANELQAVESKFVSDDLDKQKILDQGKAADKRLKAQEELQEKTSASYFKFKSESERVFEDIKKVSEMNSTNSSEARCPTCFNCITDASKNSALTFLKAHQDLIETQLTSAQEQFNLTKTNTLQAREHLQKLKDKLQQFGKLTKEKLHLQDTLDRLKTSLEEANMIVADQKALIKENDDLISQFSKNLEALLEKQQDLKITKKQQEAVEELNTTIKTKSSTLNSIGIQLSEYQVQKGKLSFEIDQINKQLEKQSQAKIIRDSLTKERFQYEQLVKLFGKDIPTFIIENACLELSEEANKILKQISNDSIEFVTQRLAKDGSQKEVFEIEITRPGIPHPILIDNLSNGQKFRVVLAIRIALSRLLVRRRNSTSMDFLFYDECFASLDDKGVDDIIGIFKYLKSDFAHQLIITHGSDVKERFSSSIIVVEQDYTGVSKIQI